MKAKTIISIALAAAMAATSIISVSAGTIELTPDNNSGNTEVKAHISGAPTPGDVSYIITIPDVVDFGELTQPAENTDSFKDVPFTVKLTELSGTSFDPDAQQISVYVKDQNATTDDSEFYIANKTNPSIKLGYEVFRSSAPSMDNKVSADSFKTAGYFYTSFTVKNEFLDGTLRLNQNQLYGRDLADIVGEYSGYMVFTSFIENQTQP